MILELSMRNSLKTTLKKMRETKYEKSFNVFSRKKIINQSNTGLRLPSGFNEDFISNILWYHQQQQQENINQWQDNISQFSSLPLTPALSEASSGNSSWWTRKWFWSTKLWWRRKQVYFKQLLFPGAGKEKIREILPEHVCHSVIYFPLHKKWSFQVKIYSVNMTKSAGSCGFGPIYWRNPSWKTSFLYSVRSWK